LAYKDLILNKLLKSSRACNPAASAAYSVIYLAVSDIPAAVEPKSLWSNGGNL
jgi:hypothetical protein